MKTHRPSRLAAAVCSTVLGPVIVVDGSLWNHPVSNEYFLMLNVIDGASRFHVATMLKSGVCPNLGKLQHTEIDRSLTCLPDKVLPEPASDRIRLGWHVRGTRLQSKLFRERGSELHMAAGEAHLQVGIVERHINVLKEMLTRLADEEKEALDPHLLLDYAVGANTTRSIRWASSETVVHGTKLDG